MTALMFNKKNVKMMLMRDEKAEISQLNASIGTIRQKSHANFTILNKTVAFNSHTALQISP